ncbi:hypothetical protein M3I53_30910 [Paraburkholderia sp. CNPSo 3272]|uniref:hypothetical protein n=1 Tax=Paraburkholderia sp. CNPSo 3272 TaxID=2940931 RepID=UPI0020B6BED1|nr:hypothetical protein [Paraburkholderia sp. CNPSo 3272]MCP3727481.1 hypothetical protein [Paraburkholderia sp. CNPSo 3272]
MKKLCKAAVVAALMPSIFAASLPAATAAQTVDIQRIRQTVTRQARANHLAVNWKGGQSVTGDVAGIGQVTALSFGVEPTDGGNWWSDSVQVFWANGHSDQVGTKGVQQMVIKDNLLYVRSLEQGDNDPGCCPTTIQLTAYRIQSGKLVAVSSKVVGHQSS